MHHGFSLLELLCALALITFGLGLSLPAARRAQERFSVMAAREELIALITQARGRALVHGGAVVVLERWPPRAWIVAGDSVLGLIDLESLYGAELLFGGARPRAELRFDGVGLGQMTARSMTVRRGSTLARIVVSAYGRVRRE